MLNISLPNDMSTWQLAIILSHLPLSMFVFIQGLSHVRHGRVYTLATPFQGWGIYVWGDALLVAPYWFGAAILSLYLRDWLFFLLTISVFWFIRGLGEMVYWLNQQFSPITREPPEKFWHFRLVKNNAVWFLNQLFAQLITIISLLATLFLLKRWF